MYIYNTVESPPHHHLHAKSAHGLKQVLEYSDSGRCQTSTQHFGATWVLALRCNRPTSNNNGRKLCCKIACGDDFKAYLTSIAITVRERSLFMAGGGRGGRKIDRRKIKRPPSRIHGKKIAPPPMTLLKKFAPPPPCLKKTCLYVAVVLLQQL